MPKKLNQPNATSDMAADPFDSVEELWFWFIAANQAFLDGAQRSAGLSAYNRPCLPADILKVVNRLYRNRRLLRDHLMVLRHYGRRQVPPDAYHPREARAATLWKEAMEIMEGVFIKKGLIAQIKDWPEPYHEDYTMKDEPILTMSAANATIFKEFQD